MKHLYKAQRGGLKIQIIVLVPNEMSCVKKKSASVYCVCVSVF